MLHAQTAVPSALVIATVFALTLSSCAAASWAPSPASIIRPGNFAQPSAGGSADFFSFDDDAFSWDDRPPNAGGGWGGGQPPPPPAEDPWRAHQQRQQQDSASWWNEQPPWLQQQQQLQQQQLQQQQLQQQQQQQQQFQQQQQSPAQAPAPTPAQIPAQTPAQTQTPAQSQTQTRGGANDMTGASQLTPGFDPPSTTSASRNVHHRPVEAKIKHRVRVEDEHPGSSTRPTARRQDQRHHQNGDDSDDGGRSGRDENSKASRRTVSNGARGANGGASTSAAAKSPKNDAEKSAGMAAASDSKPRGSSADGSMIDTGMDVGVVGASASIDDGTSYYDSAEAMTATANDASMSSYASLWTGLGVLIIVLGAIFSVVLYRTIRRGGSQPIRKRAPPVKQNKSRDWSAGFIGVLGLGGRKNKKDDPPPRERSGGPGFGADYSFGGDQKRSSIHQDEPLLLAENQRSSVYTVASEDYTDKRSSIISAGGSLRPGQVDFRTSYVPSVRYSNVSSATSRSATRASQVMQELASPTFVDHPHSPGARPTDDSDFDTDADIPSLPKPDRSSMLVYDEVERARRARQSTASAAAIIAAHRAKRNTLLAKQQKASPAESAVLPAPRTNRSSASSSSKSSASPAAARSSLAKGTSNSTRHSTGVLLRSNTSSSIRSLPARLAHTEIHSSVNNSPPQTPLLDDEDDQASGLDDLVEEAAQKIQVLAVPRPNAGNRVQLPSRVSVGPGSWKDLVREIKSVPMEGDVAGKRVYDKSDDESLSLAEKRKLAITLNKLNAKQPPSLKKLLGAKRMVMSDDNRASVRVSLPLPPVGLDISKASGPSEKGILTNLQRLAAEDSKRDSVDVDFDFEYEDVKWLNGIGA